MKSAFFILPESFFSFWRYLNFFSDIFRHVGKWLDKINKVNFKIYDFTNWEASNCNTQCLVSQELKALRRWKLISYSLDQQFKILYSLFVLYVQVEGYGNILKLRCTPLAFTSYKAFFLKKKSGTGLTASFFAWFLRIMYCTLYSNNVTLY